MQFSADSIAGRDTGSVECGVDPVAVGAVRDQLGYVDGGRIKSACAECLDRVAADRGGFDDVDLGQAHAAQREPQPDADGAGAVDQRPALVADLAEDCGVIGHRHRFDQRAHLQRDAVGQVRGSD